MAERTILIDAELTLFRYQLANFRRRLDPRFRCGVATSGRLYFPASGQIQTAWVCNLSSSGLALELSEELPIGGDLVIWLKDHETNETIRMTCKVVHTSQIAHDTWQVGCEFTERISVELLESML